MRIYKLGVIGKPIGHSLSPKIHNLFAQQTGIKIDYQPYQVSPDALDIFIRDFFNNGGDGLNITLPHKIACIESADDKSALVKKIGAANILIHNKDSNKIIADSTDGNGFVEDLHCKAIKLAQTNVLILGAGGAAQSIIPAIQNEKPANIFIDNRSPGKIQPVIERYLSSGDNNDGPFSSLSDLKSFSGNNHIKKGMQLVINTTSAGFDGPFQWDGDLYANEKTVFYDLSYSNAHGITPFLKWARQYSDQCHDGIGMLINQAALSFEMWTGIKPDTKITTAEMLNE